MRECLRVGQRLDKAVSRNALGLALELERLDRLGPDAISNEGLRRLAEQYLSCRGGLLKSRGDIDCVSRGKRLARAGDDLARVDPDPHLQLEPADGIPDLFGCAGSA